MSSLALGALESFVRAVPETIARPVVSAAADFAWVLPGGPRGRVTANVARACRVAAGHPPVARTAHHAWRGLVMNYYELLLANTWSERVIRERVRLEGADVVDAARAAGRGVIVLFVHAGAFEALSTLAVLRPDWRLVTLVERMRDPRTHDLMRRMRQHTGLAVVPVDRLREAIRRVLAGAVMLVGADRDMTHSGIRVPLFGEEARLPDGAVQMALRFDIPLLIAWATRGEGRRPVYRAQVRPLELARGGALREDTLAGVTATARAIEEVVAAHPEQWVANYDFWGPE